MKKENKLTLAAVIVISACIFPEVGFTQGDVLAANSPQEKTVKQGERQGPVKGLSKKWSKEELLKLKKDNPAEFRKIVQEHQEQIKQRLKSLKQNNPQRYSKLMQLIRRARIANLQKLRKEDPEKFKQTVGDYRAKVMERLQNLKTEDPRKYEHIMQQIGKIKELMRLRRDNPAKFREYIKNHPELRQRLESVRNRIGM